MKRSHDGTTIKIKHRNIGRPGISNVGALAVRRNINKIRPSVNADGSHDFILLRVDHADVIRPGVDDINFVSLRIGRNSSRLAPNLQCSYRPKTAQVDNGNRIALAIGNVRVLAVERSIAGKSALVEVVPAGGEDERDEDGE